MIDENFDYIDYLDVKKAVDDQSLNPAVWNALGQWLRDRQRGLSVLEIGAGIGTMVERLLDAGFLGDCRYTVVEMEAGFAAAARERLAAWSSAHGYAFIEEDDTYWMLEGEGKNIEIDWITGDALAVSNLFPAAGFDLIIGHALIDLLPVPTYLPEAFKVLKADAAFYFSMNFAGTTAFTPAREGDEAIAAAYHADMDKRFPDLDWQPSRTGLELGRWLEDAGHQVLAQGESNWRVTTRSAPGSAAFMTNILDTMDKALTGMPGFSKWLAERRSQLKAGELALFVANRDCFGRLNQGNI